VPLLKQTKERFYSKEGSKGTSPLIVHISSFGGVSYSFNVAYGVGKAGVDRMAADMHIELKSLGISCLSLYPGVVRTERMVEILDSGFWTKKTGLGCPKDLIESPILTGRVIAGLMDNTCNLLPASSGKVLVTSEIANVMNIQDINGNNPPSIRSLKFLIPALVSGQLTKMKQENNALVSQLIKYVPDILLPMSLMAGGAPQQ
jgi:dehydrogenase/reductase SDR family protein 1